MQPKPPLVHTSLATITDDRSQEPTAIQTTRKSEVSGSECDRTAPGSFALATRSARAPLVFASPSPAVAGPRNVADVIQAAVARQFGNSQSDADMGDSSGSPVGAGHPSHRAAEGCAFPSTPADSPGGGGGGGQPELASQRLRAKGGGKPRIKSSEQLRAEKEEREREAEREAKARRKKRAKRRGRK